MIPNTDFDVIACNRGKCDVCGAPATVTIVSVSNPDPETGYVDEIDLCEPCLNEILNKLESERTSE